MGLLGESTLLTKEDKKINNFQRGSIAKAIESIDDAETGRIYRHKLDEWERGFIDHLSTKPFDYELTDKENHKLNKVREKL